MPFAIVPEQILLDGQPPLGIALHLLIDDSNDLATDSDTLVLDVEEFLRCGSVCQGTELELVFLEFFHKRLSDNWNLDVTSVTSD